MSDVSTHCATDLLVGFRRYLSDLDDDRISRFMAGFDWGMPERSLPPRSLPVMAGLASTTSGSSSAEAGLLETLAETAGALQWSQTYGSSDFGPAFLAGYGWVELFGTRGHFDSKVMAGGFLLLGPKIHYPDHHHVAEEIYVPLTEGSLWSRDGGAFAERAAGEIIHHPTNVHHAMQTRETPLVALYLWRGGPLAQKPVIPGKDS